ncbi:hypothetical protein pb186bvf_015289 [Paramecium bursaria]
MMGNRQISNRDSDNQETIKTQSKKENKQQFQTSNRDSERQESKTSWNQVEITQQEQIGSPEPQAPQKKEENRDEEKLENLEPIAPQNKEENQNEEKLQNLEEQHDRTTQQQINNPAQSQMPEIINVQQNCHTCEQLQKKVIKYKEAAIKYHHLNKSLNQTIDKQSEEINTLSQQNFYFREELKIIKQENQYLLEQTQGFQLQLQEFQISNEKLLKSESIIFDLENLIKQQDQRLIEYQNQKYQQMNQPIQNESNQSSINQNSHQQSLNIQQQDCIQNNAQQFEICIQQLTKNILQLEQKLDRKKDKIKSMKISQKQNLEFKEQQIEQLNTSFNYQILSLNKQLSHLASECQQLFNITLSNDIFRTINKWLIQNQSQIDNLVSTINNQNYQFYNQFGLQFSQESMIQIKDSLDTNNGYHNERYSKLDREFKKKIQLLQEKISDLDYQDQKNQSQIKNLVHKCEVNKGLIQKLREQNQDLDTSFDQKIDKDVDTLNELYSALKSRNIQLESKITQKEIIISQQQEMLIRKEREIHGIQDNMTFNDQIKEILYRQKSNEKNKNNYLKLDKKVSKQDNSSQTFDLWFQQIVIQQIIENHQFYNQSLSQIQVGCKDLSNNFDIQIVQNHQNANTRYIETKELFYIYQFKQNKFNLCMPSIEELKFKCQLKVSPQLQLQSDYQKYQLMQVIQKDQKDKIYLIKSILPQQQPYNCLQSVLKLATNNQLLDIFIQNFEKELQIQNIPFQSYRIPQSYIFKNIGTDIIIHKIDTEKYYFAEELVNGKFTKYDKVIDEESHIQNAVLSLYSYHLSEGRMMITSMNSIGLFFYDTVISTIDGQLSVHDQGKAGISKRFQFLNKNKNIKILIYLIINSYIYYTQWKGKIKRKAEIKKIQYILNSNRI